MSDAHKFMVFGVLIAVAGFFLAVSAKAGRGQTTIKILGAEITLAAAGGIVVMLMGILTFALPTALAAIVPPKGGISDKPVRIVPAGEPKDQPPPKDSKGREALLSSGPVVGSQVSAYLYTYAEDIMRSPSLDYGGAYLVSAEARGRSLTMFFSIQGRAPEGLKNVSMQRISQQLCLTTGLRRALNLGGTVRIELTDQPSESTLNLLDARYIGCE